LAARRLRLNASAPLLVESRPDGIVVLTLNRPEKRNALDFPLLETLTQAVRGAGSEASVVILRGSGAFSAGFDLDELTGTERDLEADAAIGRAGEALSECPAPVIAVLEGHCHGGAVEIALSCDLRVAAADLKLSLRAVGLGVVYRTQLLARMIHTIGIGRTQQLLFAMPVLTADEALSWGLVGEVVAGDRLAERVDAIAGALAATPASAVRGTKATLRLLANRLADSEVLATTLDWRRAAATSDERRQALSTAKASLRRPKGRSPA
jgi:enoyl-CoA hydratase/carnithine racemase